MLEINAEQRRALRARAHGLSPVVASSQSGLSEAVLHEIARSLDHHELIKIRVFNDDRKEREAYLAAICEQLDAAPVQHIGKLLVVWRPAPDEEKTAKPATRLSTTRRRNEPRKTKRSHQG